MPRETLYKSFDATGVEPILVRPSGGILEAAVARSELNFEVAKIDGSIASKLGIAEVRSYSRYVDLAEDADGVTKSVTQATIDNVDYTFTAFEILVNDWSDTREIWKSAYFSYENEQVDIGGRFFVIGEGMVRIIFQGDEVIPDATYKVLLQRTPPVVVNSQQDLN